MTSITVQTTTRRNGNLMDASAQWGSRAPDERWDSLESLREFKHEQRVSSHEATVPIDGIEIIPHGQALALRGKKTGAVADFTNYSFGQLCSRVGAPASYLGKMDPARAAANLNVDIETRAEAIDRDFRLLISRRQASDQSPLTLRAMLTSVYDRVWDVTVIDRLIDARASGWRVPPARPAFPGQPGTRLATAEDVLRNVMPGLGIRVGDPIAPAGIYGSDRDMFVFVVNEGMQVDAGGGRTLLRGVFVKNSEVGDSSWIFTKFFMDGVCGNHIVWGATDVQETRIIHKGAANENVAIAMAEGFKSLAHERPSEFEASIRKARDYIVGKDENKVAVSLGRKLDIPQSKLKDAILIASMNEDAYGPSLSAWGISNGLTEVSQRENFASSRVQLDAAAGKIARLEF